MRCLALVVSMLAAAGGCSGKSATAAGGDMAAPGASSPSDMRAAANGDLATARDGGFAARDLAAAPAKLDAGLAPLPDLFGVPAGTVHCSETLTCVQNCSGTDPTCEGNCLSMATDQARTYYAALKNCGVAECFQPPLSKCTSSDVPNPGSQCAICEVYALGHGLDLRCPQPAQDCANDQ